MKNIKYIIGLAVLFSACSDFFSDSEDYIEIPESINFFSTDFTESSRAIYTKGSEEIAMDIRSLYNIGDYHSNGEKVKMENLEILLNYGNPTIYNFVLNATAQFVQGKSHVNPMIGVHSMITIPGGASETIALFDEGEHPFSRAVFKESMELGGNSFTDVYAFEYDDERPYSKLYVNAKQGVVGFADEKNEIWIFERFEK